MTNKQIIMRAITNKKPFTQAPDILHFCDSFILSILLNHLVNFHLKAEQFLNLLIK